MNDIVERLRAEAKFANVALNFDNLDPEQYAAMCTAAADEITLLRQQLASARDAALEEAAGYFDDLAAHHAAAHEHVESDHHARMERTRQVDATAIRSLKSGQEGKR